jgi:UDP-2,3-diacylglucosamine pyrophosphatase LpxH/biotin operon repressor
VYDKNNEKHRLRLQTMVEKETADGKTSWKRVQEAAKTEFEDIRSREGWRGQYRLVANEQFATDRDQAIARRDDKRVNRFELKDRLLKHLVKERSVTYLLDKLGAERMDILGTIQELQMKGYQVVGFERDGEEYFKLEKKVPNAKNTYSHRQVGREFKIGLVSDTHLGSKYQQLQHLHHFYEYAVGEGVTDFYHVGDISDGFYQHRPGAVYEVFKHGFTDQLDYIADVYPQYDGVTTHFITGNHDATHFYNGGANLGAMLELKRDDLVYLGHNFAKVWLTDFVDMNLVHPTDGTSYSVSLKAQQRIDKAAGAQKSKILLIGHYHKMDIVYHKQTWAFTMPSFFGQSSFMEGKNLESIIGGIILNVKVDAYGDLISIVPEMVMYDEIKEDY